MLDSVGIAPRNGWIADYLVTPDIIGELRKAVSDAADSKRLSMKKDEALKEFQVVTSEFNMSVTPYALGQTAENSESYENYPGPAVINGAPRLCSWISIPTDSALQSITGRGYFSGLL